MSLSPGKGPGTLLRPLNTDDLAEAHCLPKEDRVKLMQEILAELQSIEAPSGRDAAGIALRGAALFREQLNGHNIKELAAAYIELRQLGAQSGVIDAIETAVGSMNSDAGQGQAPSSQSELERAFREQMRQFHCPGCGDDEVLF